MSDANSTESFTQDSAADAILDLISPKAEEVEQEVEEQETPDLEEGQTEESGEESEDDTEEQEEDTEEEAEEEAEPEEDYFQVTVKDEDGNDVLEDVTEQELIHGYMRSKDYSRKRTAEGKAHKDAIAQLSGIRDTLEGTIAAQVSIEEKTLQDLMRQLPIAKEQRPDLYQQLHYKALQLQQEVAGKRETLEQLSSSYLAQRDEEQNTRIQQSLHELHNIYPDWGEKQQVLSSYLANEGFSNEDVRGMINPKVVALVEKARLYDEQQSTADSANYKRVKRKITKTLDAGVSGKTAQLRTNKAHNETVGKAKQSGSVDDAASALHALFK